MSGRRSRRGPRGAPVAPKGTIDYIYAPADGWATFIVNALQ